MSDDKYPGFPIGLRDTREDAADRKDAKRAEREDPAYLRFVRKQRCLVSGRVSTRTGLMHRCLGKVDPHHEPAIGKRTSWADIKTVALCRRAHDERHAIGATRFEMRYGVSFEAEIARLQALRAKEAA